MTRLTWKIPVLAVAAVLAVAGSTAAQTSDTSRLSLEDLLKTDVTAQWTTDRETFRSATSVVVLGREQIMGSGAQTLPDLMRMVPGVWVAQIDATTWRITTRGGEAAVVLLDGQVLSSPLFGMHWDMLNVPLREIERVEVGRGASGIAFGVNAVTTVISITTRSWDATAGGLVTASIASPSNGVSSARYVAPLGGTGHIRVHGSYTRRGSAAFDTLQDPDRATLAFGDVRANWRGDQTNLGLRASFQDGHTRHLTPGPSTRQGRAAFRTGSAGLLWTRSGSDGTETALVGQYRAEQRAGESVDQQWQFADGSIRSRKPFGPRHVVSGGLGYRLGVGASRHRHVAAVVDERMHSLIGSLQDDIALGAGWQLSPGFTIERSSAHQRTSTQPTIGLTWQPHPTQAIWSRVSRGIGAPRRIEPLDGAVGVPRFHADRVTSYEAGYRVEVGTVHVEVGAFTGRRDELAMADESAVGTAAIKGMEIGASWRPFGLMMLAGSYSAVRVASPVAAPVADRHLSPPHQVRLRSAFGFRPTTQLNAELYWVSAAADGGIDATTRVDVRAEHEVTSRLELSVGVRNFLHGRREFMDTPARRVIPVHPAAYAELEWGF